MIDVRTATAEDVAPLADLAQRTWSDAFGHTTSPEDLAAELAEKRSEAYFEASLVEDAILVAEHAGSLVGYVQFGDVRIAEADAGPGDQELRRLYVDTRLQLRGIGRSLMNAALADPRMAAAPYVFLQVWERSERAIGLYESLGFETVGRTTFRIGGDTAQDLVMRRTRPSE